MTSLSTHEDFRSASLPGLRNDAALVVLAFIWPAAAAVIAFFKLNRRIPRMVLAGVMVLLGYRMVIEDERFDAYRLADYVEEIAGLRRSDFMLWIDQYCFHSEKCIDPVQPFFTYFLTRLSDDYAMAFSGYALVFAVFSIAMLAAVRRDFSRKATVFCWFFLFAIMATNPIHNIGGFRFNTASWVFLLGAYLIFFRGRSYGFLFLILAVAFHYAMSVLLVLTIVLRFVRLPLRSALILALLSFVISPSVEWLAPFLNIDSQLGAFSRGARYLSEGAIDARAEALQRATSSNLFFLFFSNTGIKIALGIWIAYLLILKKNMLFPENVKRLLIFSLLLFGFSNLFSNIPSFSRYGVISIQLLYASFIVSSLAYSYKERSYIIALFVPAFFFSLLIIVRTGLGLIDVYSLGPLPFLLLQRDAIF